MTGPAPDNSYETPSAARRRRFVSLFPPVVIAAPVLFLILVVFLPALDMPSKTSATIPEKRLPILHTPVIQHICSRLLIGLLVFLSCAGGAGFLIDAKDTQMKGESNVVERGFAIGLLINGLFLGGWLASDAFSGFSTDHSTSSEYARGFLCTTVFISPAFDIFVYSLVSCCSRAFHRGKRAT